jgi:uncharacterized protein YecT (DUF1311 family)
MRPLILLLLLTATTAAQSRPDPAALKACIAVRSLAFPTVTPRNPEDQAYLTSCDSASLYYGIPKQNIPEARRCALYQVESTPIDPKVDANPYDIFSIAVLTMTYINGQDAPRNPDLAIRAVCLEEDPTDGTPWAEQWIASLVAMKSQPLPKPYDFCDSGPAIDKEIGLQCGSMMMDLKQQTRNAQLARFMATWTPAQKSAFQQFKPIFDAYVAAVVDNETEPCITGTAGEQMDLTDQLNQQLFDNLTAFEQGHLPAFTHADFLSADHTLNTTYSALIAHMDRDTGYCTKPSTMIRDSERAWLRYRDAWLNFAKVRYPQIPAEAWLTYLTRQRTGWLQDSPFTADIP